MTPEPHKKYTALKLIMIAVLLTILYQFNRDSIDKTWQSHHLSIGQKLSYSMLYMLGGHAPNDAVEEEGPSSTEKSTTSTEPQQLSDEVYKARYYDASKKFADHFNEAFDVGAFNDTFIQLLNIDRQHPMIYGEHLENGVQKRAAELADYHYFDSKTASGQPFTVQYDLEPNTAYLMSEDMHETKISIEDVHVSTWLANPDIFAQKILDERQGKLWDDVPNMQMALGIKANVAHEYLNEGPYIRIVVIVTTYE